MLAFFSFCLWPFSLYSFLLKTFYLPNENKISFLADDQKDTFLLRIFLCFDWSEWRRWSCTCAARWRSKIVFSCIPSLNCNILEIDFEAVHKYAQEFSTLSTPLADWLKYMEYLESDGILNLLKLSGPVGSIIAASLESAFGVRLCCFDK